MKLSTPQIAILRNLINAKGASFVELVEIAKLNPAIDFVEANLVGVDFASADLSKFNFERANLNQADLRGCVLSKTILTGATTQGARWSDHTIHDAPQTQSPPPAPPPSPTPQREQQGLLDRVVAANASGNEKVLVVMEALNARYRASIQLLELDGRAGAHYLIVLNTPTECSQFLRLAATNYKPVRIDEFNFQFSVSGATVVVCDAMHLNPNFLTDRRNKLLEDDQSQFDRIIIPDLGSGYLPIKAEIMTSPKVRFPTAFTPSLDIYKVSMFARQFFHDAVLSEHGKIFEDAWKYRSSGAQSVTEKREQIINTLSKNNGTLLLQKTNTKFFTPDRKTRVVCSISKRYHHKPTKPYWFAYHPGWDRFLQDGEVQLFALGCLDKSEAYIIPRDILTPILNKLHQSTRPDGTVYWHINFIERDGRLMLHVPKAVKAIDLEPYALSLDLGA
ncbi:MAG: pentapeptide repeat-containing protein [Allosphingosinicella sp.]